MFQAAKINKGDLLAQVICGVKSFSDCILQYCLGAFTELSKAGGRGCQGFRLKIGIKRLFKVHNFSFIPYWNILN